MARPQGADGVWNLQTRRDKLTEAPIAVEARRWLPTDRKVQADVKASCRKDDFIKTFNSVPQALSSLISAIGLPEVAKYGAALDTRLLSLEVTLPSNSGLVVKRSQIAQTVHTDSSGNATITPPHYCSFLRATVNGSGKSGLESDVCDDDRPNTVAISFVNFRAQDVAKMMSPQTPYGPGDPLGLNTLFSTVRDNVAALQEDPSFATIDEVFQATAVKIEIPLTDGDSASVTINPQDPSFQKFTTSCRTEFPPPVSAGPTTNANKTPAQAQQEAEAKRREAAEVVNLQRWGIDARTFNASYYGPPSVTDSIFTLWVKAVVRHDSKLSDYV
jgi:hypothetical protein